MMMKKVTIAVDGENWEALRQKAEQIQRNRNNLLNVVIARIVKMTKEELLKFLYE